jgi:hypothetical protein
MTPRVRYFIAVAFLLPTAAAALMAVDQTPVGRRGAADVAVAMAALLIVAAGLLPRWRPLGAAVIVLLAGSSVLILLASARLAHRSPASWTICLALLAALAAWRLTHRTPVSPVEPQKVYRQIAHLPDTRREECA